MPRKRMIDPEFWSDEKLVTVSRDARLLFIGTWNYADDEGKLRYNTVKIKAQIFPVDNDITPEIIGTLIEELLKIGVLIEYSVNGESYLLVKNFLRHQIINRPTPSKLPSPSDSIHGVINEESMSTHTEKKRIEKNMNIKGAAHDPYPEG